MAAATSLLLQKYPNLPWKNHLLNLSPYFPRPRAFLPHLKIPNNFKNSIINKNDGSVSDQHIINKNGFGKMEIKQNPFEIVAEIIMNVIKALQKPAAIAIVVGLLLMYDRNFALTASMGGSCFSSDSDWSSDDDEGGVSCSTAPSLGKADSFVVFLFIFAVVALVNSFSTSSVIKLQVGLFGLGRSPQKDLNRIAKTADTSSREGLHYVLTETIQALLQHPDYFISAYSSVDVKSSKEEGETRFNQLSIQERGKFDEETLVNINNVKKQSSTIQRAGESRNEYMVITILVAARGEQKLPPINNSKDLAEASQKLASISSSRTLAVQVLWTPQKEDDTLSEQEMLEDYPLLRPFKEMKRN